MAIGNVSVSLIHMGIFSKLFSKQAPAPKSHQSGAVETGTTVALPADPASDPNLIRVFDKYGQEMFITKDEWRLKVLPDAIRSRWNEPDELYAIIVGALNDGLHLDVLDGAARLYSIDPLPLRGTCLFAIVLMKNAQLDEAERVLRSYLEKYGEDGVVLTNLAKVYAERNQTQMAEGTLWHALELDPNQDNGLDWYQALQHERGGEEARVNALQRIAALPGSWRAQIWLARAALESNNLQQALGYYRDSLSRLGQLVPANALMQISGDFGNHGHLSELLELTEPHFAVESHALQVGNNLIKAHLDLGHLDQAKHLLDQLYSLKRPDWRETLGYGETEIAKARVAEAQPNQDEPWHMEMNAIQGPIWLDPSSQAMRLFELAGGGPQITFLGGSVEAPNASDQAELQMANAPGRMSRALPLYLAERIEFSCQARVQTWLPWMANGGFVVSGVTWTEQSVVEYNRLAADKSDYVVVVHLKTKSEAWQAELRLLQAEDGHCLATLDSSFTPSSPSMGISDLAQRLAHLLTEKADFKRRVTPPLYQLPDAGQVILRTICFVRNNCSPCVVRVWTPLRQCSSLANERSLKAIFSYASRVLRMSSREFCWPKH
ncbi:MAG: tetratricopeptide repeat protein [Pyrinomonadaceae bacterium]